MFSRLSFEWPRRYAVRARGLEDIVRKASGIGEISNA